MPLSYAIGKQKYTATKVNAYLALCATSLLWGTTWVVMKLGIQGMPALQLAYIRQFIGGVVLVSFFLFKGQSLPTRKQLLQLCIFSLFTFVFANGFSTWSLQYIPSGLGSLIGALYPLIVALIEFFYFKNKGLNWRAFVGIFLGIAGISLVLYDHLFAAYPPGFVFGIGLALFATTSWSISTVMIARNTMPINPYYGMGWQMLLSSVFIYFFSFIKGGNLPLAAVPITSWLAIAYLVTMGSLLAMAAFIYSMKYLPAAVATLYAYINPIIAIILGTYFFGEHITLKIIIGAAIALAGVYTVNVSIRKKS